MRPQPTLRTSGLVPLTIIVAYFMNTVHNASKTMLEKLNLWVISLQLELAEILKTNTAFFHIFAAFIILVLLLKIRKLSRVIHVKNSSLFSLKHVLDSSPIAWVSWEDGAIDSPTFASRLRGFLQLKGPIDVQNICKTLALEDGDLTSLVNTLVTKRQNFSRIAAHENEQDIFLVHGNCISYNGNISFALWFHDITTATRNEQAQTEVNYQLQAERESLQKLLDAIPTSVWIKNENADIIFCNKAYADVLETTPELVVTEKRAIMTWNDSHLGHDVTERVLKEKTKVSHLCHTVVGGERRLLSITEQPCDTNHIIGYAQDLTAKEQLRKEKQQIVTSIQESLEHIPNPIITYNSDMRVEFFNKSYVKTFEHDYDWLLTGPTFSDVLEDLRARHKLPDIMDFKQFKQTRLELFTSIMEPVEEMLYMPDGRSLRMVTAPYHTGGLMVLFHDVSEWLSLERRYNTLLAVHKHILDNLFEGASVYASNNRLTLYNSAFANMWELDQNELEKGPHLLDVIDKIKDALSIPGDWEQFKEKIISKVTSRVPIKEGRVNLKDDRAYEFSQTPLPDGSHLLTFLDVSDQIKIEKALLERNEALETINRIKSDFVRNLYDNIKNPLEALGTEAERLAQENKSDKLTELFHTLESINRKLQEFYELANVSTLEMLPKYSTIKVSRLAEDIFKQLKTEMQKAGIRFSLNLPEQDSLTLRVDKPKIVQAFYSLLGNAAHYNKGGDVVFNVTASKGKAVFAIEGKGIIPFTDVGRKSRGLKRGLDYDLLGVGYSLVRRYVEMQGGTLTIENNIQDGTTIVVKLPINDET